MKISCKIQQVYANRIKTADKAFTKVLGDIINTKICLERPPDRLAIKRAIIKQAVSGYRCSNIGHARNMWSFTTPKRTLHVLYN